MLKANFWVYKVFLWNRLFPIRLHVIKVCLLRSRLPQKFAYHGPLFDSQNLILPSIITNLKKIQPENNLT